MRVEYVLLALVTFGVLLAVTFLAYPIIAILSGLVFGFFGIMLSYGPSAGDFMINIATITWRYWFVSLPSVFVVSIAYSFLSKKIHEK